MPVIYQRLTDRTLSTGVTTNDLIHIVITGDTSQDPDGSSYKASINQLFDSISGYCINDLYVKNVHGCSPITVWDDTHFLSNQILQTNSPAIYSGNTTNLGGIFTFFSANTAILHSTNNFSDGNKAFNGFSFSGNAGGGLMGYVGTGYTRTNVSPTGVNFWRNKIQIRGNDYVDGMIINPAGGNTQATLWFELNGAATTKLKGDGNPNTTGLLGLGLNPDGTEDPTATLQVGGTGTTGTFKYIDGNQSNGYVLTSDNDGNAAWQPKTNTSASYYSLINQPISIAGTIYTMSAETQSFASGITISNGGRYTFTYGGIYNIQFSAQLEKNSGTKSRVFIWLFKNGSNLPNSNTEVTLDGANGDRSVASWNFLESFNAGEYFEIRWTASQNNTFLQYEAAPTYGPAIPSVILTISQSS